jgi:hypothetical protein
VLGAACHEHIRLVKPQREVEDLAELDRSALDRLDERRAVAQVSSQPPRVSESPYTFSSPGVPLAPIAAKVVVT